MNTKELYLKSLKPLAIEEYLDFYFYRPIAFRLIPLCKAMGLSPNQVTTLSLMFGLTASWFVWHQYFITACLFGLTAIFFDCCDGQLARLTKQVSPYGRVMDGLFDAIWITAFWLGIYVSGYFQALGYSVFPLMLASAISVYLHCWRFDGVKIHYLEMTGSEFCEGDLDVGEAWVLFKKEIRRFHLFYALLALVLAFQMYFFVRGSKAKKKSSLSLNQKQILKNKLEPIINSWSWLGEGHHNSLILLGILFAPLTPYGLIAAFWIILVPMNIWYIYCEFLWKKSMRKEVI